MSIEYTLDIQLTEMGFPDLFQPQEASVAETPQISSALGNNGPQKSLPDEPVQPLENIPPAQGNETLSSATGENRSREGPPRHARARTKRGQFTKSRAIKKSEKDSSVETTDDSDVSCVEDDIGDEEDFCEEEEEEEEEDEKEEGNFPCTSCDLQFTSRFKLQDHMNLHTGARPYYCSECGKRFSQIHNYRTHLRSHAEAKAKAKRYRCRICHRHFEDDSNLQSHLTMNHFENEFYECDRCKRVFVSLSECQRHTQHLCRRKIMCEKCGHYFRKEKFLKRHLEKKLCFSKLRCTDCSKMFTKKHNLLRHSFTHLGLLPYTCVRCRCHFRLARLYLKHKCKPQIIHCVACLREFLSDHDFQQHIKDTGCWGNREAKGDEIRCLECGQKFDTKDDLKKHAGAHQRVLKCAECGKGFRSALLLMSHMGGHAGQSPCLCQSCGLGFPHQQSYDSHLKTCGQTSQPTKQSKKQKSSTRSEQKTTSPKPSPPDSRESPAVSGTAASISTENPCLRVLLESQAPTEGPASSAVSKVETPAQDESTDEQGPTSSRTSSSSASQSLDTAAEVNSPEKPNQEAQADPSDPTKGLWKLSLDKPPPMGINLLLFLPVSQSESSSNLVLPCAVSQVLAAPEIQVQEMQVAAVSGAACKPDKDLLPLDLSKKTSEAPDLNIKSEPKEVEVSAPMESSALTFRASEEIKSSLGENKRPVDDGLQLSPSSLNTDGTPAKKVKLEPKY